MIMDAGYYICSKLIVLILNLTHNLFVNIVSSVPENLDYRVKSVSLVLLAIFMLPFLILVIVRLLDSNYIYRVIQQFFSRNVLLDSKIGKPRVISWRSSLMLLNYFISASLCLFLYVEKQELLLSNWTWILAVSLPFIHYLWEWFGLFLVGVLTGEQRTVRAIRFASSIGYQVFGLLFFLLALVWIMSPSLYYFTSSLFLWLIIIRLTHRFGSIAVSLLVNGMSWYYLILYFCTLEILPVFMAGLYVFRAFG
jgi:hypothetical protein